LGIPFITAELNPLPMVVLLVIGKAPEPWLIRVSTHTTASAPSHVVGIPGYSNFDSAGMSTGAFRGVCVVDSIVAIKFLSLWSFCRFLVLDRRWWLESRPRSRSRFYAVAAR
jgi:hypothetical protein